MPAFPQRGVDLPTPAPSRPKRDATFWLSIAFGSENEAAQHFASIAYVSKVRTKDGRVIETAPEAVVEEAKRFAKKLSVEDLAPKK